MKIPQFLTALFQIKYRTLSVKQNYRNESKKTYMSIDRRRGRGKEGQGRARDVEGGRGKARESEGGGLGKLALRESISIM